MDSKKSFILSVFLVLILVGVLGVVSAVTSITVTGPNGGEYVKDGVNITWTVTGSQSTDRFDIRYSPDNGLSWITIIETLFHTTRLHPWDTSTASDGTNYLIQVVETGSSPGAPDDVSNSVFTIDNTEPTSFAGPLNTYQNTATFNVPFSVTDANPNYVELYYRKDEGAWTKYGTTHISSLISFTSTGDGDYEFYTNATDDAGNVESQSQSADTSTTVDTVAPTTTDDYTATGWQTADQTITLTPTDASPSSGFEWTKYCVDTTNTCDPASGTSYTVSVTVPTEGTNYFRYASKDNAGNVQTTISKTVMIDESGPTVTVGGAPTEIIVDAAGVTATISCDDSSLSGCDASTNKFKFYDTNPGACSTTYSEYTNVNPVTGHKWVCAAAKDIAGNTGFSSPLEFTIFSTIQSAIDASSPENTITVNAGTYVEDLNISKTVELIGADKSTTTIKGVANVPVASWPLAVPNIYINASGVKIHGFTIQGPDYASGHYVSGMVLSAQNIEIYDNNFVPTKADASDELGQAIITYSKNVMPTVDISGLKIHDNTFTCSGTNGCEGIYVLPHTGTGNVSISNNQFSGAINIGITVESGNAIVSNNSLTTSLGYETLPYGTYGIRFFDSNYNETYNNIIISNNNVQNFKRSVRVGNGGAGTTIITANISFNTLTNNDIGIWARQYGAVVTANFNDLSSHTSYGIDNDGTTEVSAGFNWWGDLDPSNDVSGDVDYNPFAEDDTLTRFYAPVLVAVGDKSIFEGSTLTIILSATDDDVGDTLTYSDNVGFGSLVDNVFTWTPTGLDEETNSVTFTVSDGDLTDEETITITVANVAPVVDAGANQEVDEGDLVSFSGIATDAGGDSLTYNWDFDVSDGIQVDATGTNPTHTYADEGTGTYTVTLTVNDGTTTVTDILTVTVNNVAPIASAESNVTSAVIDESILFTGSQTDPGTSDTFTYLWNFGDEQTSTNQNPTHSYASKGTYTVTLTVTDDDEGSDIETLTITVHDLIWDLASEWNLVSVPKNLVVNTTSSLLSNEVWEYTGTSWISPAIIKAGEGYWIDNSPITELGLNYSGDCTGPQCLPSGKINIDTLNSGWNLIGLTTIESMSTSNAFGSMIYEDTHLPVYYVINYDEDSDSFNYLNGTDTMNPGKGYWVYVVQ